MKIQDIRRARLKQWLESNPVPSAEKSYFSQLLGGASFGERAARRLEADYGMGALYLDSTLPETPAPDAEALSPMATALIGEIKKADKRGISQAALAAITSLVREVRGSSDDQPESRDHVRSS
ncbi:hypothetical protein [Robbsia andropogonis]|uniref:hypothetical protein n=1 Tax=Robbsia andropogonis TaxID=28092 RepID=UPI0020A0F816|nr:hypothetical protein [Robbsia andropogonis]MCP1121556.1 hypothetical protein [Robbsia andropogonis]MCP1131358.1 hypothetical protein [Robbsia andropogonis]